ncbi:lectin-like domain-containing protein [Levilactobacillus huananensis]|uniref:lectin-like domain-containing protein n=1 Tax=Levilactobacillus huananensis TaxID=2486019 RepID=UPI001CDBFA1F|nr:hypothetical protein [Levilactobacillus huananensis]
MLKQWLSAGLILLAICLGSRLDAYADSDYNQALKTAPRGIFLDKTLPILKVGTASKSSATVVETMNPAAPNTQAAVITNGPGQFGAIWSTNGNYFDLTKDETLSFWVYLGNQGAQAGEGMAFVLQNDPRDGGAAPNFGRGPITGETLGVWGVDTNSRRKNNQDLANTAITNSWALEFDTNYNGLTGKNAVGKANSFDASFPAEHIASNYPGEAETYYQYIHTGGWGWIFSQDSYYYAIGHKGLIADETHPGFLSNGQWHHVSLQWQSANHTMTYTFGDEDPRTGEKLPGVRRTVHLDTRKIDPKQTGFARWGVTGTTGKRWENNLVVFENAPGLVDAQAKAQLTNLTRKRVIAEGGEVVSKDRVQLDYQLTYRNGRQTWSSITALLNLPEKIDFDEAEIRYFGKEGEWTEKLDPTAIKERQLAVILGRSLDEKTPAATIRLTGTVSDVARTVKVASQTSTVTSNAYVGAAQTPEFNLNPNVDLDLDVTSAHVLTVAPQTDTQVTGKVMMATTATTRPEVKVNAVLNQKELTTLKLQKDGTFQFSVKADQLRLGDNTLKLVALTEKGEASNVVVVRIKVQGVLKFDFISAKEQFRSSFLTGHDQYVRRSGHWQVVVQDTRGNDARWTLMAQAERFRSRTGAPLMGGPVYVYPDGRTTAIREHPVPIVTHATSPKDPEGKYAVHEEWTSKTGVLLEVRGGSLLGRYGGKITWTLMDTPE